MTNSTSAAIAKAKAAISNIRRDMKRHEHMLAEAKQDGESAATLREIEVLIANDKSFIASWERRIEDEKQKASDPVLNCTARAGEHVELPRLCCAPLVERANKRPVDSGEHT